MKGGRERKEKENLLVRIFVITHDIHIIGDSRTSSASSFLVGHASRLLVRFLGILQKFGIKGIRKRGCLGVDFIECVLGACGDNSGRRSRRGDGGSSRFGASWLRIM
jgi:hypothetical protein